VTSLLEDDETRRLKSVVADLANEKELLKAESPSGARPPFDDRKY